MSHTRLLGTHSSQPPLHRFARSISVWEARTGVARGAGRPRPGHGRLRGADRLTGEHGSCRCLGIGRVGFAAPSAALAVRSVHLDHLHAGIGQKPGQPGTPRAGAFHSDRAELAEAAQPPEQRSISAESRRELLGAEHPAQLVESHSRHGSPCVCRRPQPITRRDLPSWRCHRTVIGLRHELLLGHVRQTACAGGALLTRPTDRLKDISFGSRSIGGQTE